MKTTRRNFCGLAALVALTLVGCGPTTKPAQARPLRVFFIGNSFSGNVTRFLPQLAKEGGHDLVIGRAELGGAPLQAHWEGVEAAEANPEDPKGKLYSGKSLRTLLSDGTWDIVSIQQGSFVSSAIATYQPYATKLRDFIKTVQPQAEVVMHQTWAYRTDAKKFGAVRPNHLAETQREMWDESRKAYHQTAEELGIRIVPTGDAFWKVDSDSQWGYKKDAAFDFDKPAFPNLPDQTHSLHGGYAWYKEKDFTFDPNHANDAGCYLGGLVWYSFLFNESPEKLTFAPETVPAPFAAHLRQVAWQTVQEAKVAK